MKRIFAISLGLATIGGGLVWSSLAIAGTPAKEITATFPQSEISALRTHRGMASWYGPGFHGNRCANGEIYNQYGLSAAHRTLPFGTQVRVTNLNNNRAVVVRINDRGPFIRGRIIDLSQGAAQAIDMVGSGVAPVKVEVLQ
nr:septal ring lytic transglycosylase RlpA family protein [Spirulina major]